MTMPSQRALAKMRSGVGSEAASYLIQGINFPSFYGKTFYVDSVTGSNTYNGLTPGQPVATIAYAISLCTAAKGDRILVFPGHAESISAAGGITVDKSGVSIIGMGNGANRPTITWANTAATFLISAANVLIRNIRCTPSVDEVVTMFSVTAAGVTFDTVDHFETASCQTIQFLLTTAAADDLTVRNCHHAQENAAGSAQAWICLVGVDRARIEDNVFLLALNDSATSAVIRMMTTICKNFVVARNLIKLTGYSSGLVSAILDSVTTSTGLCTDNRIGTNVAANTTINDVPAAYSFNNLCTNAVDKSGIVDPVVDT